MPKWLGENKPVILPGGRALLSRLRGAGPVYNAARQRLDLVYEVLEAEPSALPLAGGSVNALVGNYQAHCLVYPAGLGRARDAWLVGTLRSARSPQAMAPLPFSHCTAGGCTQTQGYVCTDYATSSAGPAPVPALPGPAGG